MVSTYSINMAYTRSYSRNGGWNRSGGYNRNGGYRRVPQKKSLGKVNPDELNSRIRLSEKTDIGFSVNDRGFATIVTFNSKTLEIYGKVSIKVTEESIQFLSEVANSLTQKEESDE